MKKKLIVANHVLLQSSCIKFKIFFPTRINVFSLISAWALSWKLGGGVLIVEEWKSMSHEHWNIRNQEREISGIKYLVLYLYLTFRHQKNISSYYRFSFSFSSTQPAKLQKKQRGGVYFWLYGIAYWMPIQQKLPPPVLLFSDFAGWVVNAGVLINFWVKVTLIGAYRRRMLLKNIFD